MLSLIKTIRKTINIRRAQERHYATMCFICGLPHADPNADSYSPALCTACKKDPSAVAALEHAHMLAHELRTW